MRIKVHMLAFNDNGTVRYVDIPEAPDMADKGDMLDLVFKYGQNDFQPQQMTSVSMGDVIELNGEYWMVVAVGFKQHTAEELKNVPGNLTQHQDEYWKLMYED